MLLELKGEKGMFLRLELEWMALAISSLPVPLSPVIRTVELESATLSTMVRTFFSSGLRPMMLSKEKRSLSVPFQLRVLPVQPLLLDHPVDLVLQFDVVERLLQIVHARPA